MSKQTRHFVVVGGGAAGFFAAIQAKTVNPNLSVTILEAAPKALGKVKISGGGRCNVTHHCFDVARLVDYYPRGQKALKSVFTRFGPQETVNWFESRGIKLKTEPDGRMFPITDESQTIVDCLLHQVARLGVSLRCQTRVVSIARVDNQFHLDTGYEIIAADAVLLATGSAAVGLNWAQQFGHTLVSPVPSLFTFNIQDARLTDLAGISFQTVTVKLLILNQKPLIQSGPLLITHWGLSGPAILKLSAWGARALYDSHYQSTLRIDFLPAHDAESVRQKLIAFKSCEGPKYIANACPWPELASRFWQRLLAEQGLAPDLRWQDVSQKILNCLIEALKQAEFQITGKGVFKEEFVTAGGVTLAEVDFKTMMSRKIPQLYFAGEILDIDALTGGFNFQNAWSTGYIAGDNAAGA